MKPIRDWKAGDTGPAIFAVAVIILVVIIQVSIGWYMERQYPNGDGLSPYAPSSER